MKGDNLYNTQYMAVQVYVHHMDVDAFFDFINDRIKEPPNYWINPKDLPPSISGGFLQIAIDFHTYTNIREVKEHSIFGNM